MTKHTVKSINLYSYYNFFLYSSLSWRESKKKYRLSGHVQQGQKPQPPHIFFDIFFSFFFLYFISSIISFMCPPPPRCECISVWAVILIYEALLYSSGRDREGGSKQMYVFCKYFPNWGKSIEEKYTFFQ